MDKNGLVNVNFAPLAGVCEKLIDKVSEAAGWIVSRDTPDKMAFRIWAEEIEKSNLHPAVKAFCISNYKKVIKEYANIHDIVKIASDNLQNENAINQVDNDWIAQFLDASKNVSNKEFQLLWGKLLANECNNPGSIPKSVLFILQKMDKEDAKIFMNFSSFVVNICGESVPIILNEFYERKNKNAIYTGLEITYDDLCQLETLGLIKMDEGTFTNGFSVAVDDLQYKPEIRYFDKFINVKGNIREFLVGTVVFTKDGKALYKAITPLKNEEFWEKVVLKHFEKLIE